MSKKNSIKLADCLREKLAAANERHSDQENYDLHRMESSNRRLIAEYEILEVARGIADVCEQENPRFNRKHWFGYIAGECGPNGGKLRD